SNVPTPETAGVAELLAVMNRLRSPGGCPWDAEQTHQSLAKHALEEAHEGVEAIESGTRDDLLEELGDLLLQVVFHARIAQEGDEPFDCDVVAEALAHKLRYRPPSVFPPESGESAPIEDDVTTIDQQAVSWERLKQAEKQRDSQFDGVPGSLPALMRGQKILNRARRAQVIEDSEPVAEEVERRDESTADNIGRRMLALIAEADAADIDAEEALRHVVREWEHTLRAKERENKEDKPQTTR